MELDSNAHSVFLLHYHLVLVTKYRHKVFDNAISDRAKDIFSYIAPNYKIICFVRIPKRRLANL